MIHAGRGTVLLLAQFDIAYRISSAAFGEDILLLLVYFPQEYTTNIPLYLTPPLLY